MLILLESSRLLEGLIYKTSQPQLIYRLLLVEPPVMVSTKFGLATYIGARLQVSTHPSPPAEGLEVMDQIHTSGLEPVVEEKQVAVEDGKQVIYEPGLIAVDTEVNSVDLCQTTEDLGRKPWYTRPKRILPLASVTLILVAMVLGVPLGVTLNRKKAVGGSVSSPSTSTSTSIPPPAGIRPDSSIFAYSYPVAVDSNLFNISVYFQDDEGWIKESTFQSSTGRWSGPVQLVKAKPKSPKSVIAVSGLSLFFSQDLFLNSSLSK